MLALEPGEKRLIRLFEKTLKCTLLHGIQRGVVLFEKTCELEIELEQTAPTLPTQAPHGFVLNDTHSTRLSSIWRMWPIASAGLSPFGQTSVQFIMVWQRNSR